MLRSSGTRTRRSNGRGTAVAPPIVRCVPSAATHATTPRTATGPTTGHRCSRPTIHTTTTSNGTPTKAMSVVKPTGASRQPDHRPATTPPPPASTVARGETAKAPGGDGAPTMCWGPARRYQTGKANRGMATTAAPKARRAITASDGRTGRRRTDRPTPTTTSTVTTSVAVAVRVSIEMSPWSTASAPISRPPRKGRPTSPRTRRNTISRMIGGRGTKTRNTWAPDSLTM